MSCANISPCAPVNPCDCVEPAAIREQGPPGPGGTPGGTPVFQIGTVVSGPVPQVTITQVNPLLYTLNFVIPSVGTNLPNTWTAIQTFTQAPVFQAGFAASGLSTAVDLTTSGTLTSNGPAIFTSLSTFNGNTVFNGLNDFQGDSTFVNCTVTGNMKIPNVTLLTPGTGIKGTVVVQSDGTLNYVVSSSANIVAGGTALATVVPFNQAETAIAFNQPFTVPAGSNVLLNVQAQLQSQPVSIADFSSFGFNARLDDPVTGVLCAANSFSNFEASCNLPFALVAVAPGAHVMYYTIAGFGIGTSNVTLIGINAILNF